MKPWLALLFLLKFSTADPAPVVLWHGMGDTCCMSYSLGVFKDFLEREMPGVYVLSLKIGKTTIEDFQNSYFMYTNKQIKYVCDVLASDPKLQKGFNAIGFSQGSQFFRAVVQRCGHKLAPIKNLITLGGQHQGVYGLPHCFALQHKTCDYVRKLLTYAAYYSWVQKALVQATYWHDPVNNTKYVKKSEFLADINNEREINTTYIENLNNLEHFIMIKFENDTMVQPRESAWFGYYAPGQAKELITLQQSDLYIQDRLGLKKMDEAGKLIFLSQPGDHLRFSQDWFVKNIVKPYLL